MNVKDVDSGSHERERGRYLICARMKVQTQSEPASEHSKAFLFSDLVVLLFYYQGLVDLGST